MSRAVDLYIIYQLLRRLTTRNSILEAVVFKMSNVFENLLSLTGADTPANFNDLLLAFSLVSQAVLHKVSELVIGHQLRDDFRTFVKLCHGAHTSLKATRIENVLYARLSVLHFLQFIFSLSGVGQYLATLVVISSIHMVLPLKVELL